MARQYTWAVFDIDDTLYPASCGLWFEVRDRIHQYMVEVVGVPEDKAASQREAYFRKYGTSLAGLQNDYKDFDTDAYVEYVHNVPYNNYIGTNTDLIREMETLPLQKAVFTNSDRNHASNVLSALGVDQYFSVIVDVYASKFIPKPAKGSFDALFKSIEANPSECIFLDDQERNLEMAKSLGMTTILVRHEGDGNSNADYCVATVLEGCFVVRKLCI
ncbi:MAG: pyrimidine 5'-nucleotidase [Chloroflexi bacterium]|nr:pyrimidine 5'-nucleotidase [Chloroflexota bacterium]|tara:strand:+ start:1179 stop:1829 length:651 start_codon:yes stop_codon:yes gene_type:complete